MNRHLLLALGLLLGAPRAAPGPPPPPAPPPAPPPPPPLFVRFSGPPGVKVTFYRGGPGGQTLDTPFTVGLRPGYVYRVEVAGLPRFPGVKLYPALEVYGSVALPHPLKLADHPATVLFRD